MKVISPSQSGPPASPAGDGADTLRHVRRIADLFDTKWSIPGTRFRFGLDPILGLIPGVGDLVATGVTTWLIYQAHRLGMPLHVKARMALNAGIDFVIGAIPLVGDLFDFAFKANRRNLRILEKALKKRLPAEES